MKNDCYKITLDDVERRIVVQALIDLKYKQIEQNKNYNFIDIIILKFCEEPIIKGRRHQYEER